MPVEKPKRDATGRWLPGHAGGPGRPKGAAGVAKMIADATGNGRELVQWFLDVWRDDERPHRDRFDAAQWLADRFMGKALASVELAAQVAVHEGSEMPTIDLSKLDVAALEALDEALDAVEAEAVAEIAAPTVKDDADSSN